MIEFLADYAILPMLASSVVGTSALGGGAAGGGLLSGIGNFLSGGLFKNATGLLGGLLGNQQISKGMKSIEDNTQFNPFSGTIQGAGTFGPGGFTLDPALAAAQGQIGNQLGGLFGGGFGANPDLLNAMGLGGGITGAATQANQAFGQQANPFFNQQAFSQNAGNLNQLGQLFGGAAAQGLQDLSGGAQGALFGGGLGALSQAGNQQGLIQQQLDASRALAAPGEQNLINQFANREFSATRGATSGAANRQFDLQNSLALADQQRVLNAQGLGLQAQQAQQQLGLGSIGAGTGLLGQNLAGLGQNIGAAQGFAQLGLGAEGQGFNQQLQALGQNQQAGQSRLQNALGLFNTQTGAFNDSFGQGLAGLQGLLGIGDLGVGGQQGFFNAEANRIGALGQSNQALAQLASSSGGFLGGLF